MKYANAKQMQKRNLDVCCNYPNVKLKTGTLKNCKNSSVVNAVKAQVTISQKVNMGSY